MGSGPACRCEEDKNVITTHLFHAWNAAHDKVAVSLGPRGSSADECDRLKVRL